MRYLNTKNQATYAISDKRSAIETVQRYLHYVSDRVYKSIPSISIDGIFGANTAFAVSEFQSIVGIPRSGRVDYETFTELYEAYKIALILQDSEEYAISEDEFPIKKGDIGNGALLINLMIDELKKKYSDIYDVKVNRLFSESSEMAVRDLQRIFMLREDGEVSIPLYARMRHELRQIE